MVFARTLSSVFKQSPSTFVLCVFSCCSSSIPLRRECTPLNAPTLPAHRKTTKITSVGDPDPDEWKRKPPRFPSHCFPWPNYKFMCVSRCPVVVFLLFFSIVLRLKCFPIGIEEMGATTGGLIEIRGSLNYTSNSSICQHDFVRQ